MIVVGTSLFTGAQLKHKRSNVGMAKIEASEVLIWVSMVHTGRL